MNTTENEVVNPAIERKGKVSKDDVMILKDKYVKGATIDDLADKYGYTPLAVSNAVVDDVPAPSELPTQAELDAEPAKTVKKGK